MSTSLVPRIVIQDGKGHTLPITWIEIEEPMDDCEIVITVDICEQCFKESVGEMKETFEL